MPSRIRLAFRIAVLNKLQYISLASTVSSLPGMEYVTRRGSQSVSTIPIVGILHIAASLSGKSLSPNEFMFDVMIRSGSRILPSIFDAFVNVPPRHFCVTQYSPASVAVF